MRGEFDAWYANAAHAWYMLSPGEPARHDASRFAVTRKYVPSIFGIVLFMERHGDAVLAGGWTARHTKSLNVAVKANHKRFHAFEESASLKAKCVRLGHAAAFPGKGLVYPSEEAFFRRAFPTAPLPGHRPVGAAVPCGRFLGVDVHVADDGHRLVVPAAVERTDDVEVAWRLPSAFGDDGWTVEVVRHDGSYYRPVMAPDASRPLDEAGFIDACRGDDPWRDSPFERCPVGVVTCVDERVPAAAPRRAERRVADAVRVRAGKLLSVGGIVHRETSAPRAYVVALPGRPAPRFALGWRLTGLSQGEDQDPMSGRGPAAVDWNSRLDPTMDDSKDEWPSDPRDVGVDTGVAWHHAACAEAVRRAVASGHGLDPGPRDPLVAVLSDTDALPEDGPAPFFGAIGPMEFLGDEDAFARATRAPPSMADAAGRLRAFADGLEGGTGDATSGAYLVRHAALRKAAMMRAMADAALRAEEDDEAVMALSP